MTASRRLPRTPDRTLLAALFAALTLAGCTNLDRAAEAEADVVYVERSSGPLAGELYVPAGAGPHPAVLVIHGGGWRGGKPWHMGPVSRMLANEGFVTFAPAYRLTPEHKHPAQLEDVRAAYEWLAARDDVDASNIAVWGYSAGAHLALLLGLMPEEAGGLPETERPVAVIGGGSPTRFDLFDPEGELLVNLVGATRQADPEGWDAVSPVTWVSPDDPPVYLYHGTLDQTVAIEHARSLADLLRDAGVPVILDTVIGGHISVAVFDRNVERRAGDWLQQQLHDTAMDMLPMDGDAP